MDQNWTGPGTDRNRTKPFLVNPWFEQWLTNTHFRVLLLKFSRRNDNGWPWKGPIRFCLVVTALQLHLGTLVATVSVRTVYNSMFSCVVFLQIPSISKLGITVGAFELETIIVSSNVIYAWAFLWKFLVAELALERFLATVSLVMLTGSIPLSWWKPTVGLRTCVDAIGIFWNLHFFLYERIHATSRPS